MVYIYHNIVQCINSFQNILIFELSLKIEAPILTSIQRIIYFNLYYIKLTLFFIQNYSNKDYI